MSGLWLENQWLRVAVDPDAGGKIAAFVPRRTGEDMLWHRSPDRPGQIDSFEDAWTGGWDELFPNDNPCLIDGAQLPDHGEWWSRRWAHQIIDGGTALQLTLQMKSLPVTVEKVVRLDPDRPVLTTTYRLQSRAERRLPFLWAQHPAFRISPAHRIDLPQSQVMLDAAQPGPRRRVPDRFDWPGPVDGPDLRVVPPPGDLLEGYFVTDLAAGWCALTDTAARHGIGLLFDPALFRSVWLWLSYGGWRDQYVALLEPGTGYPSDLPEAVRQGTCAWLEPGEELTTTMRAIWFEGFSRIIGIDADGTVHGASV